MTSVFLNNTSRTGINRPLYFFDQQLEFFIDKKKLPKIYHDITTLTNKSFENKFKRESRGLGILFLDKSIVLRWLKYKLIRDDSKHNFRDLSIANLRF